MQGCHLGHGNPALCNAGLAAGRNQAEIPACFWRSHTDDTYPSACAAVGRTSPVFEFQSAVGNIIQFRSNVYGGQLDGQWYTPKFKGYMFICDTGVFSSYGCRPDNSQTDDILREKSYPGTPGLAMCAGPGGAHLVTQYGTRAAIAVNLPTSNPTSPEVWDIFPDRAPPSTNGGSQYILSGANFNALTGTPLHLMTLTSAPLTLRLTLKAARPCDKLLWSTRAMYAS